MKSDEVWSIEFGSNIYPTFSSTIFRSAFLVPCLRNGYTQFGFVSRIQVHQQGRSVKKLSRSVLSTSPLCSTILVKDKVLRNILLMNPEGNNNTQLKYEANLSKCFLSFGVSRFCRLIISSINPIRPRENVYRVLASCL